MKIETWCNIEAMHTTRHKALGGLRRRRRFSRNQLDIMRVPTKPCCGIIVEEWEEGFAVVSAHVRMHLVVAA
jgi:hypothetical protein